MLVFKPPILQVTVPFPLVCPLSKVFGPPVNAPMEVVPASRLTRMMVEPGLFGLVPPKLILMLALPVLTWEPPLLKRNVPALGVPEMLSTIIMEPVKLAMFPPLAPPNVRVEPARV